LVWLASAYAESMEQSVLLKRSVSPSHFGLYGAVWILFILKYRDTSAINFDIKLAPWSLKSSLGAECRVMISCIKILDIDSAFT
jgi:hypothetical protein